MIFYLIASEQRGIERQPRGLPAANGFARRRRRIFPCPPAQRVRIARTPLLQKEVSKPCAFPINKEKSSNPKNFCLQGLHFSFIDAIIYNCHRQSGAIMRPATISLAHPRRAHPEAHDSGHDTGATQNRWGISTVGSARHSHCRGQGFDSPMLHQMDIARTPTTSKGALR